VRTAAATTLAALAALAAAVAATPATGAARTSLTITAWPEGVGGPKRTWTLRCAPVGGTLPRRAQACARLARLDDAFAPVPRDAVCTMVYGGPQVAKVVGRFNGRRIWAIFRRRDGCDIARWDKHRFLFPIRVGADAVDRR